MTSYSRAIFGAQLTEIPKKQVDKQMHSHDHKHGWVFLSYDCRDAKAVRTYKTLFAVSSDHTYFTPNTFYRNDKRNEASLRWLNAMVIDIDVKDNEENQGMSCVDVLDRVGSAGLPEPSLIVQTPSGGFHVYFYFEHAKRAFPATIRFYKRIQQEMATGIGGDLCAIGAERWFRLPTADNVVYESSNRVKFQDLVDWMIIEQEGKRKRIPATFTRESLLSHPVLFCFFLFS